MRNSKDVSWQIMKFRFKVAPTWYDAFAYSIKAPYLAPGSSNTIVQAVYANITHNKVPSMKDLAQDPDIDMNEIDPFDPDHRNDFCGEDRP